MPLLAYCMMEAATAVDRPHAGVGGTSLQDLQESGVRCFFSCFESREHVARIPAAESALAFHGVIQDLFRQAILIPFRFPTLAEDEKELRHWLREGAARYSEALARLRETVQMEIHIRSAGPDRPNPAPFSGGDYLRQKQARAASLAGTAEEFLQATRPWVIEWRQRQARAEIRCYALVRRQAVAAFQTAAQAVSELLPGTRMSGPWPPAEFLEPVKDF
ncbi:MAG TPA: GvpL/GvpF family gas vesicle protein [Terriglobales bacterium]|nr:GvpL/GvpF family gas vesicle protein [Terriglobales bacterium]